VWGSRNYIGGGEKKSLPNKTERAFVKLEVSILRQQYEARKANIKATKTTLIF